MGFDLWRTLGVSPLAGLGAVIAGLVIAGLFALRVFWRNRAGEREGTGLSLHRGE
jgi:hypothetical protein